MFNLKFKCLWEHDHRIPATLSCAHDIKWVHSIILSLLVVVYWSFAISAVSWAWNVAYILTSELLLLAAKLVWGFLLVLYCNGLCVPQWWKSVYLSFLIALLMFKWKWVSPRGLILCSDLFLKMSCNWSLLISRSS